MCSPAGFCKSCKNKTKKEVRCLAGFLPCRPQREVGRAAREPESPQWTTRCSISCRATARKNWGNRTALCPHTTTWGERKSQDDQHVWRKSEDPRSGPLEGAGAVRLQHRRSRDDDLDGEVYQHTAQRQGSADRDPRWESKCLRGEGRGTHTENENTHWCWLYWSW